MRFQDRLAEEAFTEIAGLLATAYQRHVAMRQVPPETPETAAADQLDKSCLSSPHGQLTGGDSNVQDDY